MKIEVVRSDTGKVYALLVDEHDRVVRTVQHLVLHSPDGFEYGYGGSGPSDLARSIVGHMMVTDTPPAVIYQQFKRDFVEGWDRTRSPHVVTYDEFDEWFEREPWKERRDGLQD